MTSKIFASLESVIVVDVLYFPLANEWSKSTRDPLITLTSEYGHALINSLKVSSMNKAWLEYRRFSRDADSNDSQIGRNLHSYRWSDFRLRHRGWKFASQSEKWSKMNNFSSYENKIIFSGSRLAMAKKLKSFENSRKTEKFFQEICLKTLRAQQAAVPEDHNQSWPAERNLFQPANKTVSDKFFRPSCTQFSWSFRHVSMT